jgi:uncharacterized protein YyaL (SSP411 family)
VDWHLGRTREIAIAGKPESESARRFLSTIHSRFIPNKVLALVNPDNAGVDTAVRHVPLLRGKTMLGGKTTLYICENYVCKKPITDPADFDKSLTGAK